MNIKKVIKAQGWTLERLASQMTNKDGSLGVSQATISQMINGNPTLDKLKEIASIIGVSLAELVADEDTGAIIKCPHCGEIIALDIKAK